MEPGLQRFLELVRRELGADDARIEIGGRPPSDTRLVWCQLPFSGGNARVVAILGETPSEGALSRRRLQTLTESFSDTLERASAWASGRSLENASPRARLDAELSALAERSGAERVGVFDLSSPMIWGASAIEPGQLETANLELEIRVEELRSQRAEELRSAHGHVVRLTLENGRECLARMFGGIYVLAMFFRGVLSEPVAVGALLHAGDVIERLVLALPPVDPPPGGRVVRLPRR